MASEKQALNCLGFGLSCMRSPNKASSRTASGVQSGQEKPQISRRRNKDTFLAMFGFRSMMISCVGEVPERAATISDDVACQRNGLSADGFFRCWIAANGPVLPAIGIVRSNVYWLAPLIVATSYSMNGITASSCPARCQPVIFSFFPLYRKRM